jgi:hypothetical protein
MFVCNFLSLSWLLNPFSLGGVPEHGLELTNFYHSDLVYHDAFGAVERKKKIPQARRFGMRGEQGIADALADPYLAAASYWHFAMYQVDYLKGKSPRFTREELTPVIQRLDGPVSVLALDTSIREPSSSRFSYLHLFAIRTPLIPV